MEIQEQLRTRIVEEREKEAALSADQLMSMIEGGDVWRGAANLFFHTEPSRLGEKVTGLVERIEDAFPGSKAEIQERYLAFLLEIAIDLDSYLADWNLRPELEDTEISRIASRIRDRLSRIETSSPSTRQALRGSLRQETLARLSAEGEAEDVGEEADRLLGSTLQEYANNLCGQIAKSNLVGIARARKAGRLRTEFGNDYAAFLKHVIRLGGSFVTTNPVLIKIAWDIDPKLWNQRVERLILSHYSPSQIKDILSGTAGELEDAVQTINGHVTLVVVMENCQLLRPIFLYTDGREGYVSLQVNPNLHDESSSMVSEARILYRELESRLGGVPNVVFKVPATAAGLEAARELTKVGIGVTITLNFSVFQMKGFAGILNGGNALVSFIALMNGRMSFPVRDELKAMGTPGGERAARWAGVEVARKACSCIYDSPAEGGLGVDPARVKVMIASLRIYDDWIPDISELWGIPLITIFPNVRRTYDSHSRNFEGITLSRSTPTDEIHVLFESEIFRQAWWLPGDAEGCKPQRVLSLAPDDAAELADWPPVAQTLGQFIDLYRQMGEMVVERMRVLAARS